MEGREPWTQLSRFAGLTTIQVSCSLGPAAPGTGASQLDLDSEGMFHDV